MPPNSVTGKYYAAKFAAWQPCGFFVGTRGTEKAGSGKRLCQSKKQLCLSEIKSGIVMQSAEDRTAKNTPCPLYGAR